MFTRWSDESSGCSSTWRRQSSGDGLVNIRARIAAVGGTLEIRSTPGAGTVIVATIPFRAAY
jgi:signal transduction histidine kinase